MKPRIFVSSTYYDLKYIRNDLEYFISEYGFDPVLYESGGITFKFGEKLDESCYREVGNCQMMVLIIGGRYGSPASDDSKKKEEYDNFTSITLKEYRTAYKSKIPVYVFVEKNVASEYLTYQKNGFENSKIQFAYAESINVYRFIDEIYKSGIYVSKFEGFQDIKQTLKDQWAGLMFEYLRSLTTAVEINNIHTEISKLQEVSDKMSASVNELVKKMLDVNSSEREEISDKQVVADMDYLFKQLKVLFRFSRQVCVLSKDDRTNSFREVLHECLTYNFKSSGMYRIREYFTRKFPQVASTNLNIETYIPFQETLLDLPSGYIGKLASYISNHIEELDIS